LAPDLLRDLHSAAQYELDPLLRDSVVSSDHGVVLDTAPQPGPAPQALFHPHAGRSHTAQRLLLEETSGPSTRRPIRFYVGWHLEKSIDFADNAPVLEAARRERVCRFPRNDSFTDLPLIFQLFEPGYACDRSKAMFTRFCWECPRPPYFQWQVRTP